MSALYRFSKKRSRVNLYLWLTEAINTLAIDQQSHVVNIGAGGDVEDILKQAGIKARSVDIDPGRCPDVVESVEALLSFGDSCADTVILMEVLEHVRNPPVAVAEISRILRPGGIVIGSTPFLLGIHDRPEDYYRFTCDGLKQLFSDFEQIDLRARNGYFAALAVLIYRRFVVGTKKSIKIATLLSPLLLLIGFTLELLDHLLPSDEGTSGYFFVFRKPEH